MTPEEKELLKELAWAREQLNIFIALERQIDTYLGPYGFENMIVFKPMMLTLMIISTIINIYSVELWSNHMGNFFLVGMLTPFLCFFIIADQARKMKKINIFKFLGEQAKIPQGILSVVEMHVFSEQNKLQKLIEWRKNKKNMSEKDVNKYLKLFDLKSWQEPNRAKRHCINIGIMMLSVQRFLYKNRVFYDKHIGSHRRTAQKIDDIYQIQNVIGAKKSNSGSNSTTLDGINTEDFFTNSRSG